MQPSDLLAWWLEDEEECAFCHQRHARLTEVHCLGCDREGCAFCVRVERESGHTWCRACDPQRQEGGRP